MSFDIPSSSYGKGVQQTLNKPASTQASVRAVDNNPKNSAAIASAKTTNANAKKNSQVAKTKNTDNVKPVATDKRKPPPKYWHPLDMPEYGIQLLFGPYKREAAFNDAIVDHDLSIMLPLPPNLSETFGLKYNTVSFGPLVNEVVGGAIDTLNDVNSGKEFGKSLASNIKSRIDKAASAANEVVGVGFSRLAGGISESGGAAVDMVTGFTPNPSLAVAFNGVGLRSFGYTWKFAPRSYKEAQNLINIITLIKERALPVKNQYTLQYPDYVDIVLHPMSLNYVIQYKTCVINDVKINWCPSGVPSFFAESQIPTEIELTLTFQETKIFTSEDFAVMPKIRQAGDGVE